MDKIEKYITEATSENAVAKMMLKKFGVKVKNVEVKREITFNLSKWIDEKNFDNMDLIDDIHDLLKKAFKNATTKHDGDRFVVKEL